MNIAQRLSVSLRCGALNLEVKRADMPLDELCGYGSRRSRKRGFVFISKVLGKHYPVRPSLMAEVHARLAEKLGNVSGPVVFIALAETATGLGHGVYESWGEQADSLFLHTTRYHLSHPRALTFEESHSHATRHLLYAPVDAEHARLLKQARTLVLIDDELTTGRTLVNLAVNYRKLSPDLSAVHLVCLTDWLTPARQREIAAEVGVATRIHGLLQGQFTFEEAARFDPGPIPNVDGRHNCKDIILPRNYGRLGIIGPLHIDLDAKIQTAGLHPGERVLVLGTGEFAHAPFLLARRMEELGWDVHYQSTTRSPLLLDGAIRSVVEFEDNYHDLMPNFVYNVVDRQYDKIVMCYETEPLPPGHTLSALLGGITLMF